MHEQGTCTMKHAGGEQAETPQGMHESLCSDTVAYMQHATYNSVASPSTGGCMRTCESASGARVLGGIVGPRVSILSAEASFAASCAQKVGVTRRPVPSPSIPACSKPGYAILTITHVSTLVGHQPC